MTRFGLTLVGAAGLAAAALAALLIIWLPRPRAGASSSESRGLASTAGVGREATVVPAAAQSPAPGTTTGPGDSQAIALIERLLALIESSKAGSDSATLAIEGIERELLAMGELAAQALARRLGQVSLRGEARDRLFNVLRRIPGSVAETRLAEEARLGPQRSTRSLAMDALAERRTDRAFETLAAIAQNDPELPARPLIAGPRDPNDLSTELPDEEVFTPRMKALMALAETQDPRAVPILVEVARFGPDESLRMQAARFLEGLRGDPRAAEALRMAAASDPSAYVRLAALHAVKGSSDPALPPLLARIIAQDRDAGVRALAQQVHASLPR